MDHALKSVISLENGLVSLLDALVLLTFWLDISVGGGHAQEMRVVDEGKETNEINILLCTILGCRCMFSLFKVFDFAQAFALFVSLTEFLKGTPLAKLFHSLTGSA